MLRTTAFNYVELFDALKSLDSSVDHDVAVVLYENKTWEVLVDGAPKSREDFIAFATDFLTTKGPNAFRYNVARAMCNNVDAMLRRFGAPEYRDALGSNEAVVESTGGAGSALVVTTESGAVIAITRKEINVAPMLLDEPVELSRYPNEDAWVNGDPSAMESFDTLRAALQSV